MQDGVKIRGKLYLARHKIGLKSGENYIARHKIGLKSAENYTLALGSWQAQHMVKFGANYTLPGTR